MSNTVVLPRQSRQPIAGSGKHDYPMIDALRACAAISVIFYHMVELGGWKSFPDHGFFLALRSGWLAVECFFVISGVVITLSALSNYDKNPDCYRKTFFLSRLGRIVPLYYLTLFVILGIHWQGYLQFPGKLLAIHIVSHLLFVHNIFPMTSGSINGTAWTLGLEMQFYILVVILTPWIARGSALRLFLTLTLAACLYRYCIVRYFPVGVSSPMLRLQFIAQLPGVIDEFGMGMVIGVILHRKRGWLAEILRPTWQNFTLCLLTFSTAVYLAWICFWGGNQFWDSMLKMVFFRSLAGLALAALVTCAITFPYAKARVLGPLRYAGIISYGIYLWHMEVLLRLHANTDLQGGHLMIAVLLVTVLLSMASWHLLERPVSLWVRKTIKPQQQSPAPSALPSCT